MRMFVECKVVLVFKYDAMMYGEWRYLTPCSINMGTTRREWQATQPDRFSHLGTRPWPPPNLKLGEPHSLYGCVRKEKFRPCCWKLNDVS